MRSCDDGKVVTFAQTAPTETRYVFSRGQAPHLAHSSQCSTHGSTPLAAGGKQRAFTPAAAQQLTLLQSRLDVLRVRRQHLTSSLGHQQGFNIDLLDATFVSPTFDGVSNSESLLQVWHMCSAVEANANLLAPAARRILQETAKLRCALNTSLVFPGADVDTSPPMQPHREADHISSYLSHLARAPGHIRCVQNDVNSRSVDGCCYAATASQQLMSDISSIALYSQQSTTS